MDEFLLIWSILFLIMADNYPSPPKGSGMKTKRLISLALLLGALVAAVSAAPVSVAFVDGTVHVLSGSSWQLLDFDDRFDSSQSDRKSVV